MITTIYMTHALDADAIKRENTKNEIADFIMELDGCVGESSFTEGLILDLARSLANDVKCSDMIRIGDEIANLEGFKS